MKLLASVLSTISLATAAPLLTGDWVEAEHDGLPYIIYGEKSSSTDKKRPLIIALHGQSKAESNGTQGWVVKPLQPALLAEAPDAILVAPLCYQPFGASGRGWEKEPGDKTLALIDQLVADHPIDPARIYIYGYSMGGGGTVHLMTERPDLFAAGIVMAGWPNVQAAEILKNTPLWAFHGAEDTVVPPKWIRMLAEALKDSDTFRYTEFPGKGHNIAADVVGTKGLAKWFLAQRKTD